MNIALIAHDNRKELMVQFCTAYCGILAQHTLCATANTGKQVQDATGLPVHRFLTFENGNLSGVADKAGTYTVVLDAVSTVGPEQHATQTVTLIVSDSSESGTTDYELKYGSSVWSVEQSTEETATVEEDDSGLETAILAILVVIVAALAVRRFIA